MRGTVRRYVLFTGFVVLVLVNYLDLEGTLRLGLTNQQVMLASIGWLGLWGVVFDTDREELATVTGSVAWIPIVGVLESLATGVMYPNAGVHYRLYATPLGMAAQSNFAVGFYPLVILVGVQLLWWLEDYWHLRRTTPEERVLGSENSYSTDNTEPTQ